VPRAVHRILDVVVMIGLVVVAIVFGDDMGGAGQLLLFIGAAGLGVLTWRSDYGRKAPKRAAAGPATDGGGDRAEAIGRGAGRLVGRGVQEYRRRRTNRGSGG
jgi:hypothetical protein